jgi:hypothetical protein
MDDALNTQKTGEQMNSYRSGPPGDAARATKSVSGGTTPSESDTGKAKRLPPLRFTSPPKSTRESSS